MSKHDADELREFDPNRVDKLAFATYIPRRSPTWKLHRTRGPAIGAMSRHTYATLYEFGSGGWVELGRFCPEDHNGVCSICHGPTVFGPDDVVKTAYGDRVLYYRGREHRSSWPGWRAIEGQPGYYDTGTSDFRRKHGKIIHPLEVVYLCPECRITCQ